MPAYSQNVLVLRKTKLGETDVIVTLLAEDGRQIRAVAKGMRRPGSRFGGRLEPYSVVKLLLHTGRSLDVVSEANTLESNAALREDFERSAAAAVVVDLLDKISVEAQVEPRLFALSVTTLGVLAKTPPEAIGACVVAFLLKALAMHGYRPELESCASCAGELASASSFSLSSGGALCSSCGALDPSALRMPSQARAWLVRLLGATMAEVADLQMPPEAVADCLALIRAFTTYHVPARLKALDFFAGTVG